MVDLADVQKLTQLYEELRQIEAAIANFDAGGTIVAMTISGGPPDLPALEVSTRVPISIATADIAYPATVVDAIKTALAARATEIDAELNGLGVTGTPGENR
jgi:hypothetical protein